MYTVHTLFVEMSTGAQAATASNNSLPAQNFDFFLVLDFEATCDSATKIVPQLTGITQDKVDGKPTLQETMKIFEKWMEEQGFLDGRCSFVFVTCGDWDLKTMLPGQCSHFRIHLPQYFKTWINIKRTFQHVMGQYPKEDLMGMLKGLSITHQGRHHSGIDDCRNIANILKALAERGCIFQPTYRL
ncbi:ERI1 exoribonuclease 3-like isoform X3 [Ptychodera flava]|uniref:ERI1 exoribonuclease 3-like isoform X3 n=1 Tax=Ptychodera flava TaxID=63121 RepID=UPI00396A4E71